MPTSAFEGRGFFTNHLSWLADEMEKVVDFGPGEGTYSILGRHIAPNAEWIGVEIFEPYIERYGLTQKYDTTYLADLRHFTMESYTLGIFGDVLEHLREESARSVLGYHSARAKYLYVSVPIIPAPQGPSHGNHAETHLHDWTFDTMSDLLRSLQPVDYDAWCGHTVGRWWVQTHD